MSITKQAHTTTIPAAPAAPARTILDRLAKQTFCTLATSSPGGFPHVAGVVYEAIDPDWTNDSAGRESAPDLWIHTTKSSRKARSVAAAGRVAVCVPFRRLPVGPPFTIHFQADAEIVAMDDERVRELLDDGKLASITGHGELDMPDGCFIRVHPRGTVHSFGPGARILDLIRDPIGTGGRSFTLEAA